jgi:hypothetical protein
MEIIHYISVALALGGLGYIFFKDMKEIKAERNRRIYRRKVKV